MFAQFEESFLLEVKGLQTSRSLDPVLMYRMQIPLLALLLLPSPFSSHPLSFSVVISRVFFTGCLFFAVLIVTRPLAAFVFHLRKNLAPPLGCVFPTSFLEWLFLSGRTLWTGDLFSPRVPSPSVSLVQSNTCEFFFLLLTRRCSPPDLSEYTQRLTCAIFLFSGILIPI